MKHHIQLYHDSYKGRASGKHMYMEIQICIFSNVHHPSHVVAPVSVKEVGTPSIPGGVRQKLIN